MSVLEPGDRQDPLGETFEAARRLSRELRSQAGSDERSRRYRSQIAQAMDVGVVLADADLRLTFANRRARSLLAAGQGEMPGWAEIRAVPGLFELDFDLNDDEGTKRQEVTLSPAERGGPGKTLRLTVQAIGDPQDGGSRRGYVVLLRDAKTGDALVRDLQLAAQLRGLMGLFMGLTHDLKAPLNAMVLNLELLKRTGDGSDSTAAQEERQRRIEILEEELHRLGRSLERLLAQAAPARPEVVLYDAGILVEEVGKFLSAQARQQKVELTVVTPAERLMTWGSPDLTKQALINLAVNGFEAQPEGGEMRLEARREEEEIVLEVEDAGDGIPSAARDRLFELHFTTKDTGTGLGLYVSRILLESQGGRLLLAATGPGGTTFQLRLPGERPV